MRESLSFVDLFSLLQTYFYVHIYSIMIYCSFYYFIFIVLIYFIEFLQYSIPSFPYYPSLIPTMPMSDAEQASTAASPDEAYNQYQHAGGPK